MHRHFDDFLTAVIASALLSAAPPAARVGPRSGSKSSKKRSLSQKVEESKYLPEAARSSESAVAALSEDSSRALR